jgi:hypothetical protein
VGQDVVHRQHATGPQHPDGVRPPARVPHPLGVQEQQVDGTVGQAGEVPAAVGDLELDGGADAGPVEVGPYPRPLLRVDADHPATGVPRGVGEPDRRVPVRCPDLHHPPGGGDPRHHGQECGRVRFQVAPPEQPVRLRRVMSGAFGVQVGEEGAKVIVHGAILHGRRPGRVRRS